MCQVKSVGWRGMKVWVRGTAPYGEVSHADEPEDVALRVGIGTSGACREEMAAAAAAAPGANARNLSAAEMIVTARPVPTLPAPNRTQQHPINTPPLKILSAPAKIVPRLRSLNNALQQKVDEPLLWHVTFIVFWEN